MTDLRTTLFERLTGRVCLLGIGNANQGDDGLGMQLAQDLQAEREQRLFIRASASVPADSSIAPRSDSKPAIPDPPSGPICAR